MSSEAVLAAALQQALAAEQRAAFAYPILGPHLTGDEQDYAVECSDAHEELRDTTAQQLAAAGRTPQAPAADYPGLYPTGGRTEVLARAVAVEQYCAAAWRYLYAVAASATTSGNASGSASGGTSGGGTGTAPAERLTAVSQRASAQAGLSASAVRATRWRTFAGTTPATVTFPGT